jgi:DNA-damage-inducible protein D
MVMWPDERRHHPSGSPFDAMRPLIPEGCEYWSARDLMPLLGDERWESFDDAVERAKVAALNVGYKVADQFRGAAKGSGAERVITDYHLSWHACCLIALDVTLARR